MAFDLQYLRTRVTNVITNHFCSQPVLNSFFYGEIDFFNLVFGQRKVEAKTIPFLCHQLHLLDYHASNQCMESVKGGRQ